jgi:hypothetical protein
MVRIVSAVPVEPGRRWMVPPVEIRSATKSRGIFGKEGGFVGVLKCGEGFGVPPGLFLPITAPSAPPALRAAPGGMIEPGFVTGRISAGGIRALPQRPSFAPPRSVPAPPATVPPSSHHCSSLRFSQSVSLMVTAAYATT